MGLRPSAPPTARAAPRRSDPAGDLAVARRLAPRDRRDHAQHATVPGGPIGQVQEHVGLRRTPGQERLDRLNAGREVALAPIKGTATEGAPGRRRHDAAAEPSGEGCVKGRLGHQPFDGDDAAVRRGHVDRTPRTGQRGPDRDGVVHRASVIQPVPQDKVPELPKGGARYPRSRRAFETTVTDDSAMAPGGQDRVEQDPGERVEDAHRDRDQDRVVGERPEQVLADVAHRRPRQADRGHEPAQVAVHQGHARRHPSPRRCRCPSRCRRPPTPGPGASLIPSPTMATGPPACSRRMASALPSGRTSARTTSMPALRAMASAVRRSSPVSMATSNPRRRRSATAAADPGLSVSATAIAAAARPSKATMTGRLAVPGEGIDGRPEDRDVDPGRLQEGRAPDDHGDALDGGDDAVPGDRRERRRLGHVESSNLDRVADDRLGDRMLGAPLGRGDQAQDAWRGRRPDRPGRRR